MRSNNSQRNGIFLTSSTIKIAARVANEFFFSDDFHVISCVLVQFTYIRASSCILKIGKIIHLLYKLWTAMALDALAYVLRYI